MAQYGGAFSGRPFTLLFNVNEIGQSIPGNYSTDQWSLQIRKDANYTSWTSNPQAWNVNVGGNPASGTFTYNFGSVPISGIITIAGPSNFNIAHNADGTKTISNSASAGGSGPLGSASAGGSLTQTTIPRASTPTFELVSNPGTNVTTAEAGVAIKIETNRASGTFTHEIDYSIGSVVLASIATGVGADYASWTIPLSLMNEIPNTLSGIITITVRTYSGATLIGTTNTPLTMTVPTSVVPDFTTITHAEATSGLDANVGAYVEQLTTLALAITGAVGAYSSTIVAYKIEVAGQTINAISGTTPAPIAASGSVDIVGTITDSRGRTHSETVTITVLSYSPPSIISITGERALSGGTPDNDGEYIRVNINAAVQSLLVSAVEKNALTYKIWTRPFGTSTFFLKENVTPGGITFNSFDVTGTATPDYPVDESFDVLVQIIDDFATSQIQFSIAVAQVFMDWHANDGVGFGKRWQQGSGDFVGEVYSDDGAKVLNFDDFAEQADVLAHTDDELVVTPESLTPIFSMVHYGTISGIDSTGITIDLEDGFGSITAIRRNPKYYPISGDRVMIHRSDDEWYIMASTKVAGSVRVDLPMTTNWIRYSHEVSEWNSIASSAGPYRPPYVYKTTNNIVKVSGLVKKYQGGAFTSGEKIATLPVGFRPDYPCVFMSQGSTGGTVAGSGRLAVDTDGSIYAIDTPADSSFVSLEGIIFPIGLTWTDATLLNSFTAHTSFTVPGGGPTLTIPLPGYAQDSNLLTWTRGAVTRATDPADGTAIFTYPNGLGPVVNSMPHWRVAGHTSSTVAYSSVGALSSTNRNRTFKTGTSSTAKQFLDGTPFVSESSTLAPYGANAATPQPPIAGSTAYTTSNVDPRAYLTPEGLVLCHGLQSLAATSGQIGVMHPDLRPLYKNLYGVMTTGAPGRVDVQGSGRIFANSVTSGWTSVDNLHWMADAGVIDQAYSIG